MNFIDIRDFAEAAALIISSREYAYGTYELAGTVNYSRADLEDAFSAAAHRPVKTVFIEDASFLQKSHNTPDSYSGQTLLAMFSHYNSHGFSGNDQVFRMITRRRPATLQECIASYMK